MLLIWFADSLVDFERFLISVDTTLNPLPYSPALADSIAAFKPNKFVCLAILSIKLNISSVFFEFSLVISMNFWILEFVSDIYKVS